jgi:hypothetical protein
MSKPVTFEFLIHVGPEMLHNEREAGFPQGTDALKSGDCLSPLTQLIYCQPHRGEFAISVCVDEV